MESKLFVLIITNIIIVLSVITLMVYYIRLDASVKKLKKEIEFVYTYLSGRVDDTKMQLNCRVDGVCEEVLKVKKTVNKLEEKQNSATVEKIETENHEKVEIVNDKPKKTRKSNKKL